MKNYSRREFLSSGLAALGVSAALATEKCSPAFPISEEWNTPPEGDSFIHEFQQMAEPQQLIGKKAPKLLQFNANPLSARWKEFIGPQDYLGKVVFLNLWASWCGPCRREIPELAAFYQAHSKDAVVLAMEASETSDWRSIGLPPINFPILEKRGKAPFAFSVSTRKIQALYRQGEEYENLGQVMADYVYGLRAYPTTYVIDRRQVVRDFVVGATRENNLEGLLRKYK